MAYEGGYTSAINSAKQRELADADIDKIRQAIAFSQLKEELARQDRERKERAREGAVGEMGQFGAPPEGPPPQTPPPGEASQPMQPPQGPPPPMAPGMGGGTAAMFGAPPPGGPPGAPPGAPPMGATPTQPQGWKPGATAPPALGGTPAGGPGSGAAGAPQLGNPPPSQKELIDMGAATLVTKNVNWVADTVQKLTKAGKSQSEIADVIEAMGPMVEGHNKMVRDAYEIELKASEAARNAAQAVRDRAQAGKYDRDTGSKPTTFQSDLIARYGSLDDPRAQKELDAHIKRMDAPARTSISMGGGDVPAGAKGKTGADFLKSLPDKEQALVKGIAEGKVNPNTLSTKGGHRENIMNKVLQYDPNYDQQEYGVTGKTERDFATGKQGNSVRAFNVALEHLDTLGKLGDALKNSDVQGINKIANMWKTQTGQAGPTNFDGAKQLVADEVVKAIVGSGGGVTDRTEAAKTIMAASSPAQLKGVIDTYKKLFDGQLKGLAQQYKAGTGKDDFEKRYLTPRGRGEAESGAIPEGWTVKEH